MVSAIGIFGMLIGISFLAETPEDSSELKSAVAVSEVVACVVLPWLVYLVFLNKMFYKVVKERMTFELNKKKEVLKEKDSETVNSALLSKDQDVYVKISIGN